jgi:hypothetical protein
MLHMFAWNYNFLRKILNISNQLRLPNDDNNQ